MHQKPCFVVRREHVSNEDKLLKFKRTRGDDPVPGAKSCQSVVGAICWNESGFCDARWLIIYVLMIMRI
jgi:hypothetical protein